MTETQERAAEIAAKGIADFEAETCFGDPWEWMEPHKHETLRECSRTVISALLARGWNLAPPGASVVEWRPEVIAFASAMEERLQKCEAMADVDTNDLLALIYDEAAELEEQAKWYPQDIYLNSVAVRLALCSMLVTNKLGRLSLPTSPKQGGA